MLTPLIIRSRGDAQIKLAVDPQHPNRMRAILTLSDEVIGRPIIVELAADELRNVLGDALRLISADQREVDQWWMQLRDKPRPEPALPEPRSPSRRAGDDCGGAQTSPSSAAAARTRS
jgi:hypothetical protein